MVRVDVSIVFQEEREAQHRTTCGEHREARCAYDDDYGSPKLVWSPFLGGKGRERKTGTIFWRRYNP